MKTTLDLPGELVREMKLRALNEGRKLKDTAADLIRRGLESALGSPQPRLKKPRIEIQPNGLPLVHCAPDAAISKMTAAEIIALEQETQTLEDLQRLGSSV